MAHTTPPMPAWRKTALWAGVLLVLALVFMLYLQPAFMIGVADQLWACF